MLRRKKKRFHEDWERRQQPLPKTTSEQIREAAAPPWIRRRLVAELLEDAHPGTGVGGDCVDALAARDRDGKPVLWASHVEGVLRDAARRLHGQGVAESFFGRRGGRGQRAVFTSLYAIQNPSYRVWRSTARSSFDNRAPKDDTLRAIEFVPKGTCFEGLVELPSIDLPLLQRLVAEVDALGSGRAAGAGRVKLALADAPTSSRAAGSATARMVLLLRNLDPLCITATATPDNLIPTLPFVPGRALLGALAAWLFAEGRSAAAAALAGGRISVSDALPLPDEPRALAAVEVSPAPLSLQSEKPRGAAGDAPWWALPALLPRRVDSCPPEAGGGSDGDDGAAASRLKRPEPDLFVCRFGPDSPWAAYRPLLRVRLRNGRSDPDQPDPSLFAVEQIAERTCFLAELRADAAEMQSLVAALRPVLEGRRWLRIGRGGAPVEVVRVEPAVPGKTAAVGEAAYLTLTSDLLVRDQHLRWFSALSAAAFSQIPGWPVGVTATPKMQDFTPIHGFNGTSRLWQSPATAIRRGSVFRVEGPGVADLARAAAAGQWLGERSHEGFGRYRLDERLPGVTEGSAAPASARVPARASDDLEEAVAATTRAWFEGHKELVEPGNSTTRRPSRSQWQDLVADLQRRETDAISSRLQPATAGAQSWKDPGARAILNHLNQLPVEQRSAHARLFVRWLLAGMRGRAS